MLSLTYEGLPGIKLLILLLYIWLDIAVKPLKYVYYNTLWLWLNNLSKTLKVWFK